MKMINIEIKWAIIFSLVTLLWMTIEKLVGLHDRYLDYHVYLTNLFAIPAIWMVVLALMEKKKNFYKGNMSFKQGLICGTILSTFIALLSPLTQWITSYVITPEYFTNVIKRSVELGMFESTEKASAQFNYKSYAIQGALGAIVMGVVTTTIAMIFLRTKK